MKYNSTIICDIDDVIIDLVAEWIRRYNEDWNDNVKPERIVSWEIDEYVKCGKEIYKYLNDENLYDGLFPIENSLAVIKKLRNMGYTVIFGTASYHLGKIRFLSENGFLRSDEDWVVSRDKNLICGDYLIDDNFKNVEKFHGTGILFDRPWNKKEKWNLRFDNWINILNYFQNKDILWQ